MSEHSLHRARLVSVVAATLIALACGTNYVYSAWGPPFAERMKLSSTQSNLIATCGNLGMYAAGIPVGILIDRKGARPGSLAGSCLLGLGYFSLHRAYILGPGSIALPWLCLCMFMTGIGGALSFSGAIKTSALNWPKHRGTATAFPLSAFGLSAFFFALIANVAMPGDTAGFLLVLSIGTFCLIFISGFFLRVVPITADYQQLPGDEQISHQNPLTRVKSADSSKQLIHGDPDPGTQYSAIASPSPEFSDTREELEDIENVTAHDEDDKSHTSEDGIDEETGSVQHAHRSIYTDVRGLAILKTVEFYQYFLLIGILTGIGLMTINNIGNNAQALWRHFDPSVSLKGIRQRQAMHVSVLSLCSFLGRLLSGIGSDLIVKKLHLSRVWCLFLSSLIFLSAQIVGIRLENPNFLVLLAGLTGLGYGFLFGCFPSIIASTFGIAGLSQNWGTMMLSPAIFANTFNLMYGRIYDSHSTILPDGGRECTDGRFCYNGAYFGTFVASVFVMGISLWTIRHQHVVLERMREEGREHLA